MVRLNRIYTRSGDAGQTSLGDGQRTAKTHPRITAMGDVDELNCALGVALAHGLPEPLPAWLLRVQNQLFDLGAGLCMPLAASEAPSREALGGASFADSSLAGTSTAASRLDVTPAQIQQLEQWIDITNAPLGELTSFILPGGTVAASQLHLARAICRRAERSVFALAETGAQVALPATYLNRLSDLLFVLARAANVERGDILWRPGE